jgi:hypothetical protein
LRLRSGEQIQAMPKAEFFARLSREDSPFFEGV